MLMEGDSLTPEQRAQLEQLAERMARGIPDLDCPECCDVGVVFQYMERSAGLYREEWEWACLSHTLVRVCGQRKARGG